MPPKGRNSGPPPDSPALSGEVKMEAVAKVTAEELTDVGTVAPNSNFIMIMESEERMMVKLGASESSIRNDMRQLINRSEYMNQTISDLNERQNSFMNEVRQLLTINSLRQDRGYTPQRSSAKKPQKEPSYWFEPVQEIEPDEQMINLNGFESDEELAFPSKTPKNTRLSLVDGLEQVAKRKIEGSNVKYYEQAPKPAFKLDTLKYSDVYAFIQAYRMHMIKYPQAPVQLQVLIDRRVQTHIMSSCMIMREDSFFEKTNTEILKCIQVTISPKNKKKFYAILNGSIHFDSYTDFQLDAFNFVRFYDRLITFVRDFMYIYKFLYESIPEDKMDEILPPITNKEGGLIKLFLEKIPCGYGDETWKAINGPSNKRFSTLQAFIDVFMIHASAQHKKSLTAEELQSELPSKKDGGSKGFNRKMNPEEKDDFDRKKPFQKQSLHHFRDASDSYIDDLDREQIEEYSRGIAGEESAATAQHSDNEEDSSYRLSDKKASALDAKEDEDLFDADEDEQVFNDGLNAMMGGTGGFGPTPERREFGNKFTGNSKPFQSPRRDASKDDKGGCFGLLYKGRCEKHEMGRCPFKHDKASLLEAKAKNMKQLEAEVWRGQADDEKPSDQEKKGFAPGPGKKPGGIFRFKGHDEKSDIDARILNAMLNYVSSESTLIKAVVTDGFFCIEGDLYKAKCMLDSGAVDGSYIDRDFLDGIRHLVPERIKPYKSSVYLADKKTVVISTEVFEVNLMFQHRGACYYVSERLRVLPSLGCQIIIGLPTIVRYLLPLHCAMLQDVADSLPMNHLEALNQLVSSPWSVVEEDAPEDEETPLPSAFPEALHYLSISHEEAVSDYHNQFEEHVSPNLRSQTNIESLLKSTKGVNAFVPSNWDGINNIGDGIEFNWKSGMPESMKPPARPVNPRLFGVAEEEFKRLRTYFYQPSDSPIASPLVIAPKATKPFIRFCGDYSILVNKYIETGHYPIPNVLNSIRKITTFKLFCDFDLANSFHQFRLAPATSRMLSVQTPWGQYQPLFMPEGVPPASGILQKHMEEIFAGFEDWTIVIFDNLLVLANSYQDCYEKTQKILERCNERNLVLKFSKTWLGFDSVEFFGYKCSYQKFELTEKRKKAIMEMPFPKTLKQMQRFLGCALFFKNFVPRYAELASKLTDMTAKTFNWNKSTWTYDYESTYEQFKEELMKCTALFYPDYELPWILRVDASEDGIGWVLMQDPSGTKPDPTAPDPGYQPLVFGSKKFSQQAYKWDTFNKEAFAMYYSVKDCEYLLRGKPFTLQGDHANLRWIEASQVPKVIRWRVYMQSFAFQFDHIKGSKNIVADWQSRLFALALITRNKSKVISPRIDTDANGDNGSVVGANRTIERAVEDSKEPDTIMMSQMDMLKSAHSDSRSGHFGSFRTYSLLNKKFSGHGLSIKQVEEFVRECPVCQKVRLGMETSLVAVTRHLKVDGPRRVIGIDYLEMEKDKLGNIGCYVMRDHFVHNVFIYPVSDHNATTAATAIFMYCVYFAAFDTLISDPGFDFTSDMIKTLNMWFGIHHRFSLVDRHESNGVEGANKQILRHVKTLICDERIKERWSSPSVIGWVTYLMNKFDNGESGMSPYELMFGSDVARNLRFPAEALNGKHVPEFLKQLNTDLETLKRIAFEYQQRLVAKRTEKNEKQNLYQPGDLIFHKLPTDKPLPSKLRCRYEGPYEVLRQYKNDVECRHLAMGDVQTFFVEHCKPYIGGSREKAIELARIDADQYVIESILAHRGDPHMRTSMEFYVKFQDDEKPRWRVWDRDLFNSQQYADYCKSKPALFQLVFDERISKDSARRLNSENITEVKPGDKVFLDLRFYGTEWYRQVNLPEKDFKTYVVECVYQNWVPRSNQRKITAFVSITDDLFTFDHVDVFEYGSVKVFDQDSMVLVDNFLIRKFPRIVDRGGVKVYRKKK